MYYYIILTCVILLLGGIKFSLILTERKKLGKMIFDLTDLNIKMLKIKENIIMIIGFIFILVYYNNMFYTIMDFRSILIILICSFFIILGISNIFKGNNIVGIYENGVLSNDGVLFFDNILNFNITKTDERYFSVCIFYRKSKILTPQKLIINNNNKNNIKKFLIKNGCIYTELKKEKKIKR